MLNRNIKAHSQQKPTLATASTDQKLSFSPFCILARFGFSAKVSKTIEFPLVSPSPEHLGELISNTKSQLEVHYWALFFQRTNNGESSFRSFQALLSSFPSSIHHSKAWWTSVCACIIQTTTVQHFSSKSSKCSTLSFYQIMLCLG